MEELNPILQIPQYLQALLYGVQRKTNRKHAKRIKALIKTKEKANIELGLSLATALRIDLDEVILNVLSIRNNTRRFVKSRRA